MTHSTYSAKELKKIGISEGFVRLSIGIEDRQDLIEDLSQALKKVDV
jgi:cystathionine beta-lyase/cystathionine gamma-synthase